MANELIAVTEADVTKREVKTRQQFNTEKTAIEITGLPAPSAGMQWAYTVTVKGHEVSL